MKKSLPHQRKLFHFLSILGFMLLFSTLSWGQTTVFTETFTSPNVADPFTGGTSTPSKFYTKTSTASTPGTAILNSNYLALAAATISGKTYLTSTLPTVGYNSILNANLGIVTWTFNMRVNRNTNIDGLASTNSGNYVPAQILVSNSANLMDAATKGYAVSIVLGSAALTHKIQLHSFTEGLGLGGAIPAVILSSGDFTAQDYLSVKITYSPSTNVWTLAAKSNGPSSFSDPANDTYANTQNTTNLVNASVAMSHFGYFYQHGTGTAIARFDNVKVVVGEIVNTPSISSLSNFYYVEGVGPSAPQSFTFTTNTATIPSVTLPLNSNYEICNTAGGTYSIAPTIASVTPVSGVYTYTIYARLKAGLVAGSYPTSENITISTTGAIYNKTVTLSASSVSAGSDNTPPAAPGTFTLNSRTDTSLNLSWGASATTGSDLTGYLLVRYSNSPALETGADPNQTTTYSIGATYATGTPPAGSSAKTGTVIYLGSNLTFTDTNLISGTNYYYKVYAYDLARNYSASSSDSPFTAKTRTLLATPIATSANGTDTGFNANWQHVNNASSYSFYVYTNPGVQTNIVGWTFPDSWAGAPGFLVTADVANSNNTTKQFSLSSGTLSSASGVTTNAASAGTFHNQSGTITTPVKWFQVNANTIGYKDIKVSSSMFGNTNASARDFKLQYSITGPSGTFTDVTGGAITCAANSWVTLTDLILPAECENASNLSLRWMQTSFTDISGTEMTTASSSTRIDNIYIKGSELSVVSGYPTTVSVSGTPAVGDIISTSVNMNNISGTYYYGVIANPGSGSNVYVSSLHSNYISSVYVYFIPQAIADYRSKGDVSTSSANNWEFSDGVSWFNATVAPTGTNNITVSSGNLFTLGANFSVASGKTITVLGTINLAGYKVTGSGGFTLSAGATLKLGNNESIAIAITTTSTLSTAANYFYDGTVVQYLTSLPSTITGNLTISNSSAAGVYLIQHTAINSPGVVAIAAGTKLWFGDGQVTDSTVPGRGTFNLTGTGSFTAGNGSTFVVTGSKGLSFGSGNMAMTGTRTWGSDVNFSFYKKDGFTIMQMGDLFATNSLNSQNSTSPEITSINHLEVNNPYGVYLGCINPAKNPLNTGYTSGFNVNAMLTDFAPLTDITIKGNLTFISGKLIANIGTLKLNAAGTAAESFTAADGTTRVTSVPTNIGTATVIVAGSILGSGTGNAIPNGYTDGKWVVGNLKKLTSSGNSPTFLYPIGDAINYMPITLTFTGNTSASGGLTARLNTGEYSGILDSGINVNKCVNRTWSLTNFSLAGYGTYSSTFNYAITDNDADTYASNYVIRRFDSNWTNSTVSGTPTNQTATATGISGFGDFSIGENLVNSGPVSFPQSFCGNAVLADLKPAAGSTFKWYQNETGGTNLSTSTVLASGTYYVSSISGFNETLRTPVSVTVNANSNSTIRYVDSITTLQSAVNASNCGDVIILADGTYSNGILNINKSNITVKAATSGGVYWNSTVDTNNPRTSINSLPNRINISGNFVTFSGFQFTQGDIGDGYIVEVTGSNNKLTQLNFSGYYAQKYIRIADGTQYNEISYCNIEKKPAAASLGCTIQINTSNTIAGYHKIRYCSFQEFYGLGGDFGNEPIRIGLSTENNNASRSVVEYCYFNNTGLGDSESVSIKSKENTIRYCTFTNQQNAMLVFRNGDNNIAYSNFFINAGGIRVKEANNIYCYNNYFYNSGQSTGPNATDAVTLLYAAPIDLRTSNLVNINFIHNTFVDCANIDFGGIGATNNTWANNIFKRTNGAIFVNPNSGTTFTGNMYQGTLGVTISEGMSNTNPNLTNTNGYFGLPAGSPAINAASSSYPAILNITGVDDDYNMLFDGNGKLRPYSATAKDVGCDEYISGTITNHPLVLTEVGPSYLGVNYRSTTSGDLATANIWETSTSGGSYTTATNPPTGINNITISTGHNVTLSSDIKFGSGKTLTVNGSLASTSNISFNDGATAIFGPSSELIINGGTTNFNACPVILQSNSTGTARIGTITGSLLGATNVTIERYIPAKRAWRALTTPLKGSNASIFSQWQNNGTVTAGTGVELWGPAGTGSSGNGLAVGPSNSILQYVAGAWVPITDTNTTKLFTTNSNNAFMVFPTGSYGSGFISSTAPPVETTLIAKGELITGDVPFSSLSSTNYTLIGNPYASPISPSLLLAGNTSFGNNLWIWDSKAAGTYGVGAYNSYEKTANTYTNVTNSDVFSSTPDIQSGQAFFVKATIGTPTLTISESFKSSSTTTNIFLRNAAPAQLLRVGLYKQTNNQWSGRDGAMAVFLSDAEANQISNKMANGSENIAFTKNGILFASEHHLPLVASDVLNVKVWNTTAGANYKLKINTEQFNTTNLNATLEDVFTNSRTPINLDGTAVEYPFAVTTEATSTGNRFRIVFETNALGINNPKTTGISILPNPIMGDSFQVNFGTLGMGMYSYSICNTLGQEVEKGSINNVTQNTSYSVKFKNSTAAGMYIMKVTGSDNTVFSAKIIKQ